MTDTRVSLPTVIVLLAIVGAGAFAAGRSMPSSGAPATTTAAPPPLATPAAEEDDLLPPGHPPTGGASDLMGATEPQESSLEWKAPPRWQLVPNASTMRIATYRVPRAPGDAEDAELSITQAGGTVDANAERWIAQFDATGQKTAKRATRKVGALEVTTVEVQGTYAGGMGKDGGVGWALLGAIVATPGMPHFFKLTGPIKTVAAARAEFDALISSLTERGP
jgi:hypothetical protein